MELELEGAAVLEVVEGAVEGSALRARRLRVERVGARVELRALLRVRQHLRATHELLRCTHRDRVPECPSARVSGEVGPRPRQISILRDRLLSAALKEF